MQQAYSFVKETDRNSSQYLLRNYYNFGLFLPQTYYMA